MRSSICNFLAIYIKIHRWDTIAMIQMKVIYVSDKCIYTSSH